MSWEKAFEGHKYANFLCYQFWEIVSAYDTMFSEYSNSGMEMNVSELAKMFNEEMLTRGHSVEDYDWTDMIEKALTSYLLDREIKTKTNLAQMEVKYTEYDWAKVDSAIEEGRTTSLEIEAKKTRCTSVFDYVMGLMVTKSLFGIMRYHSQHPSDTPGINLVDDGLLTRYIHVACWMEDPVTYLRYKEFYDNHAEETAHRILDMYRKKRFRVLLFKD